MTAVLIFIVLPIALIAASFFIKPLVQRRGGSFGESMAAGGPFGSHGLEPDQQTARFTLDDVKKRECSRHFRAAVAP